MTISKSGYIYWLRGETITVRLLTVGVIKEEEDGTTRRYLGKERWWHVIRGRGWQRCARGDCHICETGHQPTRLVAITLTVDGEPWNAAVPVSLNDALARKMEEIEAKGLDPLKRSYRVTKLRKRPYWDVKIV